MKSVFRHLLRHASKLLLLLVLCLLGMNAHAAGTYTVTTLSDSASDPGSLRTAIGLANGDSDSTIVFAANLSGTILIQSAEPDITGNMTINGPGAKTIIIDGGHTTSALGFRPFWVNGVSNVVTISGLTIQHGFTNGVRADDPALGGALLVGKSITQMRPTVTVNNCTFSNNSSSAEGGAVQNYGTLTMIGCTLIGNRAPVAGGGLMDRYGSITMTNCTLTGNSCYADGGGGYGGGGVCLYSSDCSLTMTNCVFDGNTTSYNGGGIYDGGGTLTATGCTFTANSGAIYGGIPSTSSLTNDILYSDGSEINNAQTSGSAVTTTYCDIQGGYQGTGNINADPQFVRAPVINGNPGGYPGSTGSPDYGDLHLNSGSPCIGAGTSSAPAYRPFDLDGNIRNNPPAIGAYEGPGAAHGLPTHTLYTRASDGTASIVTINPDSTQSTQNYGPYAGWTARAIAEGQNGPLRLLWINTDGRAWLWNLSDTNPSATGFIYGPYTDNAPQNKWSATAISVGPDNAVHLLWNNTDYRVMLWTVDSGGGFTLAGYGPYTDNAPQNLWSATAVATGPDNVTRIVWNDTDYRVMLWDVKTDFTFTLAGYGPYTDDTPQHLWSAVGVSVGSDNLTHLLWSNTDRRIMFWDVNADFSFGLAGFGPYTDGAPQNLWSVAAVATGANNLSRLVWNNPDGNGMLWAVDSAFNSSSLTENPAAGFTAVSLAVGP